jgi:dihydroneopterin aldolase
MKIKESFISLKALRFHALHGVMPQERIVGNDYTVDCSCACDFSKAFASDDVADTLDYSKVYAVIAEEMAIPSALLENVAGRIAEKLFEKFAGITEVKLTITKLNPPFGADCDGASVSVDAMR